MTSWSSCLVPLTEREQTSLHSVLVVLLGSPDPLPLSALPWEDNLYGWLHFGFLSLWLPFGISQWEEPTEEQKVEGERNWAIYSAPLHPYSFFFFFFWQWLHSSGFTHSNCRVLGFSSSHVWMWELDYKESWAPKNWCFWTAVLEKTLESPLDCKEIQPVHPEGAQSWVLIGRTDIEAETQILCPPDAKSWLIGKDPDAGKD